MWSFDLLLMSPNRDHLLNFDQNTFFDIFTVVEHVLAIAGGYNESGKLSQDWAVVMPEGRECTGIEILPIIVISRKQL
jgi:hypothetical protein